MSELSQKELDVGLQMISQQVDRKSRTPEEAAYFYRLGVAALKQPQTPRLVFAKDATLQQKIDALEEQLKELREAEIRESALNGYKEGLKDMSRFVINDLPKDNLSVTERGALMEACEYQAYDLTAAFTLASKSHNS